MIAVFAALLLISGILSEFLLSLTARLANDAHFRGIWGLYRGGFAAILIMATCALPIYFIPNHDKLLRAAAVIAFIVGVTTGRRIFRKNNSDMA